MKSMWQNKLKRRTKHRDRKVLMAKLRIEERAIAYFDTDLIPMKYEHKARTWVNA